MFNLVAMIEHIRPSSTHDHYVFYILNNKKWYKMDDFLVGYTSDDNKIQLHPTYNTWILMRS